MDNDFLNSLLKQIVQSFGLPSSIIDDFENVEFARTVAMSNLEMARMVLACQNEINEPLTKLIRSIIMYEMPDFDQVNEICAKLTPPAVIVTEMNKERIQAVTEVATMLVEVLLPVNDGESIAEKDARKFKENYLRKNIPTLDWDQIDDIISNLKKDNTIQSKKDRILAAKNSDNGQEF